MSVLKFSVLSLILLPSWLAAQYCAVDHFPGDYQWITKVKVANLEYHSANETYADNTAEIATIGQYSTLTVNSLGYAEDTISVYIDWNQDTDFEDEGEHVVSWAGAGEHSLTLTPPLRMPEGETRMRIRALYQEINACGTPAYIGGETEDYTLKVTWSAQTPLELKEPNGGETLNVGQPYTISWNNNEPIGNVTLKYQVDSGEKVIIAENIENTGSYVWTVPDVSATNVVVEVSEVNGGPSDISESVFRINPLALLSPAGGEELAVNTEVPVTWSVSSSIETVDFSYRLNGGDWVIVAENIPNSGTYNWTIPNVLSDSVQIRLEDPVTQMQAASDSYFSFTGAVATRQLPGLNPINLYLGSKKILQISAGDITHVNIRNIKGELLKTLKAHSRMLFWDGRDHNMNPVSAGLYFFEFAGPQKSFQQKAFIFPMGI